MQKLDDDKLLKVLLKEKVIEPEDAQACQDYQKRNLEQRGKSITLTEALEKLDILSASRLDSFIRAVESSSISENIPIFTSDGKVDIGKEDKPKIARATLGDMGSSKRFAIRQEIAEEFTDPDEAQKNKSKTVSLFAVNQEKVISAKPKGPLKPETRSIIPKATKTSHIQVPQEVEVKIESPAPAPVAQASKNKSSNDISLWTAYLMLVFLGIFGVHRFYLRKDRSAILYSLTLGLFFVGVIVDFLLMPWLVALARKEDNESFLDKMDVEEPQDDEVPQWSIIQNNVDKFKSFVEFNIQCFLTFMIPLVLCGMAFVTAEYWIIFLLAGAMILLLIGNSDDILKSSVLTYIPFLSSINTNISKLSCMYKKNKPIPTICYLLYPLWGPIMMFINDKKKDELILFSNIFATTVVIAFSSLLYSFSGIESVMWTNGYGISLLSSKLVITFITVALLVTFFSASIRWQVQDKQVITTTVSFWGVVVSTFALLIFFGVVYKNEYNFYHKEKIAFEKRLSSSDFCKKLQAVCESYIDFIQQKQNQDTVLSEEMKRQSLYDFFGGMLSVKEIDLLSVRTYDSSDLHTTFTWIDSELQALYVKDKYNVKITKWNLLDTNLRRKIIEKKSQEESYLMSIHNKIYPDIPKKERLLGDLISSE